jgi:hypothetical protein
MSEMVHTTLIRDFEIDAGAMILRPEKFASKLRIHFEDPREIH